MLPTLRDGLTRIETWLAGLSLLLLLLLALAQVLARNLFDTGIPTADTLVRHLVLYVMFFGAVLAIDARRHITIDVATAWMPASLLAALFRPLHALGAVICGLLAWAALRFWLDEWQYAPAAEHWMVLLNLILPLGFTLLSLHFLLAALIGPVSTEQDA